MKYYDIMNEWMNEDHRMNDEDVNDERWMQMNENEDECEQVI